MGFILSSLAIALLLFVHILWNFLMMIIGVKDRKWYKLTDSRRYKIAYKIDIMGNYIYYEFWDSCLSKGGYKFGRLGETISSVLGKKQQEKSLSIIGWIVLGLVNLVDYSKWTKGGHCKCHIQSEVEINNFASGL